MKNKKNKKNTKKANNVLKIKTPFESGNFIQTKKLRLFLIVITMLFVFLIGRIGYLQFVQGNYLKEKAYNQQAINQIISPKRGNIYDSLGNALAISTQVDTITINPAKLLEQSNNKNIDDFKDNVAKTFSEMFGIDYNEVLTKLNSSSNVETIAKKVDQSKVDELKKWMNDNNISLGINIDEDSKRYYPGDTLAAQVIGFCGNDNQGLSGIESSWDSILTGTPGKIVSSKGSNQQEIPDSEETYISAENGSDLTLTIDSNIQRIVEKYLKQAVDTNDCKKGGNVIVMNPKTGDILAMATYPTYNLNEPYTPNASIASNYDSLSTEEKSNALYKMWSNKSVAETYEPGSVFKVITASVALEENITTTDKPGDFYCKGYEEFEDTSSKKLRISCWSPTPHYSQSLREALEHSCNPAFMQLGKRIGASTLYKYYGAFGLFESTHSGLYGEQSSIFQKLENVGPVELATMSFGQRLNITPLQMITAISSIANDGVLLQPRIVKQYKNTDTGAVTEVPVTKVRQVVSAETAKQVRSLMESVVTDGSGRHAAVQGYSIGGKTGTSEPIYTQKDNGYVASYCAIAPVEDTQVTLLLTLYDPPASNHQGGTLAGPVVSQMLSEILPYLGIPSSDTTAIDNSSNLITVPNVKEKTLTESKKTLEASGFTVKTYVKGDPNSILVADQNPKPGAQLSKGSVIILYGTDNNVATSVAVPDLKGLTASQATTALKNKNLNINIDGTGYVSTQEYVKDEQVPEGTIVKVTLKQKLVSGGQ